MSSIFGIGAGGDREFYPYKIDNSLRFDDGSSHVLARTPSGSGDSLTTWTWSAWVKRGNVSDGMIFSANYNSNQIGFSSDRLYFEFYDGSNNNFLISTAKLRDPSSWYHVVFVWNTTDATSSNRMRIYLNGSEITTFDSSSYPSQNRNSKINTAIEHQIGKRANPSGANFDGYLAEINFIDGQALTPSSFGETKSGVWIPKDTSGLTFGTNGFRLEFGDSSAIGDDTSGNTNDFTATNLSTHDVVPDSPTLNYAVLNSIWQISSSATLEQGNLFATCTGNNSRGTVSTLSMTSGKWYAEFDVGPSGQNRQVIGICNMDANTGNTALSSASDAVLVYGDVLDDVYVDGVDVGNINYGNGNVMGIAVNMDDGEVSIYKNGVLQITVSKTFTAGGNYAFHIAQAGSSATGTFKCGLNFGQDSTFAGAITGGSGNTDENGYGDFKYAVPSGFLALNSANLAEPSITPSKFDLPEDYFDVILWEGTGSAQSITGLEFSPNFVWLKNREHTDWHNLMDTVRTNSSRLSTNNTNAEDDGSGIITSFDSNGFSVGTNSNSNRSGDSFVAWNWLAGTSDTGTSNTNGSITSTVSANTKAGFSIVSYTGTGSIATVGHGLSSAPDWIVVKNRDVSTNANWSVYHSAVDASAPEDFAMLLNLTSAKTNTNLQWNDTAPTSTVVTLGTENDVNNSGSNHIMYCFHSVEGYSKFGSYTGNGSTDGSFVYTGFRPAFIMHKRTDSTSDWFMFDNKRLGFNPESYRLIANSTGGEADGGEYDIVSNGFKIRFTSGNVNASGGTYIYMAFAEMPFKYANAR